MESPAEFCCVMVTAPSIIVARKVANAALAGRLVACANLFPKVESHYWWEGKLESASEVLIFFKTTRDKLADLEQCIAACHPYDTPEFIALNLAHGSEKYLRWIESSVQIPE